MCTPLRNSANTKSFYLTIILLYNRNLLNTSSTRTKYIYDKRKKFDYILYNNIKRETLLKIKLY